MIDQRWAAEYQERTEAGRRRRASKINEGSKRQEAARAARVASIHKKMETGACLGLVTRHDHIKEIVPQIVSRIVPETFS
jgi:hypothetical protein